MIFFIDHDLLHDPASDDLIQALIRKENTVYILGPSISHHYAGDFLTLRAQNLGAKEVVWPTTNTMTDTVYILRQVLDGEGSMDAVIVSEKVAHQSTADMMGLEFVRGFDWIRQ